MNEITYKPNFFLRSVRRSIHVVLLNVATGQGCEASCLFEIWILIYRCTVRLFGLTIGHSLFVVRITQYTQTHCMGKIPSFLMFRQAFYTKHWNFNLLKENLSKNTEKERLNRWFNIGRSSFYVKGLHLSQGRLSLLWLLPLSLSLLPVGQVCCCRNSTHIPPNTLIFVLMFKTLRSWVSYTARFQTLHS